MDERLSADDIPLLLPAEDVGAAQCSAAFLELVGGMPVIGPFVGALSAARATGKAVARDNEFVNVVTSLWAVVKQLESRLDEVGSVPLKAQLRDNNELRKPGETTLVLDSYLGLAATMYLPQKHVPSEQVGLSLKRGYVDALNREYLAVDTLSRANRIRKSMNDAYDTMTLLHPAELGNIEHDAMNFWHRAFEQARLAGSRMLASLLLAYDPTNFNGEATKDRDELMDFLTTAGPP